MTDYCSNIVKVFVPQHLANLVPEIVTGLAAPHEEGQEPEIWLSFDRLIPRPTVFDSEMPEIDVAISAYEGLLHPTIEYDGEKLTGRENIIAFVKALSADHAAAVETVKKRHDHYGVITAYEWQLTRWGTKWDSSDCERPTIQELDEIPGAYMLPEYEGSIMISWTYTTATSPPTAYLDALARLCASAGLGMKAWYSDNEGYAFNPHTNDTETLWTELEHLALEIEETSAVRRLELAGGLNIEPDEIAEKRIDDRHPIYRLLP